MRCYGSKEHWFLQKVPSGMLPALEIDGQLITESDDILLELEKRFGPLGRSMLSPESLKLRQLERLLFRAWCFWLCSPRLNPRQQDQACKQFNEVARQFVRALQVSPGPWLCGSKPETVDLVFVPFVERMNASLAYYKGYMLREEHPCIDTWLKALEMLETYRGTQSDFHTHVHDLPPQMGGCWSNDVPLAVETALAIDKGNGLADLEACWPESFRDDSLMKRIALTRVLKHRTKLLELNPLGVNAFDQPLRASLTRLLTNQICSPEAGSSKGLRYLRDRISVPRDMPLPAARLLRKALEATAAFDGDSQPIPISKKDRFDQNPTPFLFAD